MVRRRLLGIIKTSGEKLNHSSRMTTPRCTSKLKNALGTGLVLAIGLVASSANSKVMPPRVQMNIQTFLQDGNGRKGLILQAVQSHTGVSQPATSKAGNAMPVRSPCA